MGREIEKAEVIEPQEIAVPDSSTPVSSIGAIEEVESRIRLLERVLNLAIKRTDPSDWCDQNGKPYLMESGCAKVRPIFGVDLKTLSVEKFNEHDDRGDFYYFVSNVKASAPHFGSIEVMGTCTSRDKFFAKAGNEDYVDDKGQTRERPVWKPQSEVDIVNIRKKCLTNGEVNGVTRLLGLRNLSFDRLKQAGLDVTKIGRVEYKNTAARIAKATGTITDGQSKRLWAISKTRESLTGVPAMDLLRWCIDDVLGDEAPESSKDIKKDDYTAICERAEIVTAAEILETATEVE